MTTTDSAADAAQAPSEAEGQDGSDKPPHGESSKPIAHPVATASPKSHINGATLQSQKPYHGKAAKAPTSAHGHDRTSPQQRDFALPPNSLPLNASSQSTSVPMPLPEAHALPKQPGHTRGSLEKLVFPQGHQESSSTPGSMTPSPVDSPSPSESESWSVPSTRPPSAPPSQAPSRAPSMSGAKPDLSSWRMGTKSSKKSPSNNVQPPTLSSEQGADTQVRKGTPSVHSDGGTSKFTLKDLLTSGPKLVRRSSMRSNASSKKSDSENGGKSTVGESTASLLKKYGSCERVAIGKGATSVVRLAHKWDRTEEKLYAVKEFRKRRKNETEKEYVKKLTAEFCISSTLHHVNIVETVDLVQDENQHWCEVMEFCPGGDLYAAIKRGRMSPSEIECSFKQILSGVSYLHSQGVAHRDIKPENLFFDTKGHVKIGDYGASTVYRLPWEATVHMSTGLCGSEPYIAPEQFLGKPYDARLVDIWACAVVYYCLHFQELPWRVAQSTDALYAAYTAACANPQQTACPPTINNLSPRSCRSLIRRMLEPDPKQRALIEECMQHPWIQSIEVCHMVEHPQHVHVNLQSLQQQVQVLP
ncbi:hypothetical protein EWM64_g3048 [Hericium alpestre]|uniref:non-specific serine/threonine protein kinase n=1 Tax=Hericium alpestre TaxID=135208 RepID=A0A4Z0A3Y7_9AGAM|nr:hypothetical protein EWM64_g3048 [Hericium alpestre]